MNDSNLLKLAIAYGPFSLIFIHWAVCFMRCYNPFRSRKIYCTNPLKKFLVRVVLPMVFIGVFFIYNNYFVADYLIKDYYSFRVKVIDVIPESRNSFNKVRTLELGNLFSNSKLFY